MGGMAGLPGMGGMGGLPPGMAGMDPSQLLEGLMQSGGGGMFGAPSAAPRKKVDKEKKKNLQENAEEIA